MKKFYFVRHGLSVANKSGVWSGRTDHPLAPEGRKQARLAGQKAKNLDIDLIVCSPLSRARETAEIIANEIGYPKDKIMVADILKEHDWGDWEGQPYHEVNQAKFDSAPNSEKSDQLLIRAEAALRSLESLDADNILVVSHGTFGRALRHHAVKDMPFVAEVGNPKTRLPNGEILCWL